MGSAKIPGLVGQARPGQPEIEWPIGQTRIHGYLSLARVRARQELPTGHADEVRTPTALVEYFLDAHSEPRDRVLDIFAGYGTTLAVTEETDRLPYGVEYEADRVARVRDLISNPDHVRHGRFGDGHDHSYCRVHERRVTANDGERGLLKGYPAGSLPRRVWNPRKSSD